METPSAEKNLHLVLDVSDPSPELFFLKENTIALAPGFTGNDHWIFCGADDSSDDLPGFPEKNSEEKWCFGHLGYDLKNEFEDLCTNFPDHSGFGCISFFNSANIQQIHRDAVFPGGKNETPPEKIFLHSRTTKAEYLENVRKLKQHIHLGNIYEINYCIEFFAEKIHIDPVRTFSRLYAETKAPFSALYKKGSSWLLCASPERFLRKNGDHIISQPIKGTRPRGKNDRDDLLLLSELKNDPKEKSENVMIVDLVRNDLSRIAEKGSVKVDELFGLYSFPSVHQMISTVSAELKHGTGFRELMRASFPMGSMTGAPKISAMKLIGETENFSRGIFSGSVGYLDPQGNFDFNVVIRSIEYNAATGFLSIKAGSAITANCDAEKEYEECMVKVAPLLKVLNAVPE
ncbi:MAG: anthranilate synthase component I family protein [Bacteroidetes bacterium]|nr:anthranilate synthase component I family protein [Bacteroidota bacterium]